MGIQKNMALVIRTYKERKKLSTADLSDQLEVSRSTLQEYLNETGNPRADTIDHIAEKLGMDSAVLVTGVFDQSQLRIIMLFLDTINEVSKLSKKQKHRFSQLFLEMISLWNSED